VARGAGQGLEGLAGQAARPGSTVGGGQGAARVIGGCFGLEAGIGGAAGCSTWRSTVAAGWRELAAAVVQRLAPGPEGGCWFESAPG
jgi:hypothetical protein